MTETLGFLLIIFIVLYFDKRDELKGERKKKEGPSLFEDSNQYAARDSAELSGEE